MRPPLFFEFLTPPPPGADGPPQGEGAQNNIWCGSVHALLRYRSKTAKMQKFPIDSHTNENFICLFFRPPGAANPLTTCTSFPFLVFALPWAKISRRSHHPTLRCPQPYKQTNKQTNKSKLNITPNATLYGEIIRFLAAKITGTDTKLLHRNFCVTDRWSIVFSYSPVIHFFLMLATFTW